MIGLGQISGVQGLRGAVKVRPDAEAATTDPEVFAALGQVWIGGQGYAVLEAGRHKNQVILQLGGVDTRSQAEAVGRRAVKGDRRRFPPLPPGEYYWFQVLGLPVINADDGARWAGWTISSPPRAMMSTWWSKESGRSCCRRWRT